MGSMEAIDIRDTILLCDAARKTITKVMIRNKDKGEPGRWRKQLIGQHLCHAYEHINKPYMAIAEDGYNISVGVPKEDIEHALVRLTMALIKLEEQDGQRPANN